MRAAVGGGSAATRPAPGGRCEAQVASRRGAECLLKGAEEVWRRRRRKGGQLKAAAGGALQQRRGLAQRCALTCICSRCPMFRYCAAARANRKRKLPSAVWITGRQAKSNRTMVRVRRKNGGKARGAISGGAAAAGRHSGRSARQRSLDLSRCFFRWPGPECDWNLKLPLLSLPLAPPTTPRAAEGVGSNICQAPQPPPCAHLRVELLEVVVVLAPHHVGQLMQQRLPDPVVPAEPASTARRRRPPLLTAASLGATHAAAGSAEAAGSLAARCPVGSHAGGHALTHAGRLCAGAG